ILPRGRCRLCESAHVVGIRGGGLDHLLTTRGGEALVQPRVPQDAVVELDDGTLFEVTVSVRLVRLDQVVPGGEPGVMQELCDGARPRPSAARDQKHRRSCDAITICWRAHT